MTRDQIFTPEAVAVEMARMLLEGVGSAKLDILEPGAGAGALIDALFARGANLDLAVTAVEYDPVLASHLRDIEVEPEKRSLRVIEGDFLKFALDNLWGPRFTHAIMNPPYAKLSSKGARANDLRKVGLYAPNIYASFILCTCALLEEGGTLVALVPRSFFNGPHFRSMRRAMAAIGDIDLVVTFKTRTGVFQRDAVLQDVVIFRYIRSRTRSSTIQLVYASDDMSAKESVTVPRSRVSRLDDDDSILHVPSTAQAAALPPPWLELESLELELEGVELSTGPVVDFRVSPPLSTISGSDSLRVVGAEVFKTEPIGRFAEADAIPANQIYDPGIYVIVKRISPKEQLPRLQYKIIQATGAEFSRGVAFENHVHVFHRARRGLNETEVQVLTGRLGSHLAERYFVEMSGSTQVNASDIRRLIWP